MVLRFIGYRESFWAKAYNEGRFCILIITCIYSLKLNLIGSNPYNL